VKKTITLLILLILLAVAAVFSLACFAGAMPATPPKTAPPPVEDPAALTIYAPLAASPTPPAACAVTAESLNVRTAPEGVESSRVLAWVYAGEVVTITETRGAWLFIRAGSVEGWINSKFCRKEK